MKIETAPFYFTAQMKSIEILADYGRNLDAFLVSGHNKKTGLACESMRLNFYRG